MKDRKEKKNNDSKERKKERKKTPHGFLANVLDSNIV